MPNRIYLSANQMPAQNEWLESKATIIEATLETKNVLGFFHLDLQHDYFGSWKSRVSYITLMNVSKKLMVDFDVDNLRDLCGKQVNYYNNLEGKFLGISAYKQDSSE